MVTINKKYHIDEVFGTSNKKNLNYIFREGIDDVFQDSIAQKKHIVIHGCSKQGKTTLRKKYLDHKECITIYCKFDHSLVQIYSLILKQVGFEIESLIKSIEEDKEEIKAGFKSVFGLTIGGNLEIKANLEIQKEKLELDINDVNDIITALNSVKFEKYIILEDFHYLSEEVQRKFFYNFKVIDENSSVSFLIIGVWCDENKIYRINGDLSDRVVNINLDNWSDNYLSKIVSNGEKLLNIRFENKLVEQIILNSNKCVFILKTLCYHYCIHNKIKHTGETQILFELGNATIYKLISNQINVYDSKFVDFIRIFSNESNKNEQLDILILACLIISKPESIINGLHTSTIQKMINIIDNNNLEYNTVIIEDRLKMFKEIQIRNDIVPIILEFDIGRKTLNIIDKNFFLWITTKNIFELLDDACIEMNLKTKISEVYKIM